MSRWLKNVGDFLEQLDGAGDRDDDVTAARDLAKSLQESVSVDEDETPGEELLLQDDVGEETISNKTSSLADENEDGLVMNDGLQTPARVESEDDTPNNEEAVEGTSLHETPSLQDFQTPVAAAPSSPNEEEENFMTPTLIPPQSSSTSDKQTAAAVQQFKARIASLESEKSEIAQEARKLRKHMVTLNEQLEHADTEIEAQRGELEQAATLLEAGRQQAATKLQSIMQEHAAAITRLSKESTERLAAAALKHQQQQDALRHELLMAHDEHQQQGGDLASQLQQANKLQAEMASVTENLKTDKDAAVVQSQRLQLQLEALNDQLEEVAEQAQSASLREQAAAAQLDQATTQHQTVLQRHRERESDLEQQLAQVASALAQKQSALPATAAPLPSSSKNFLEELEACQTNLLAEQEESARLRAELQAVQSDQSHDILLEQESKERIVRRLESEITELRNQIAAQPTAESAADLESHNERIAQQQEKLEALSEQVVRQRETLSHNHGEITALRTRLTAALNRATIAEAAAEAPLPPPRMARNRRSKEPSSMREALGGSKKLDTVDKFLSGTLQILRRHPLARLAALLYLLILHLWTLFLIVFHAHASNTDVIPAMPHGPGSLLRTNGP